MVCCCCWMEGGIWAAGFGDTVSSAILDLLLLEFDRWYWSSLVFTKRAPFSHWFGFCSCKFSWVLLMNRRYFIWNYFVFTERHQSKDVEVLEPLKCDDLNHKHTIDWWDQLYLMSNEWDDEQYPYHVEQEN